MFQFTRPMQGATRVAVASGPDQTFQFTRPVRGATGRPRQILCTPCFNSRAPCGARQLTDGHSVILHKFQFTRPVRGATSAKR